VPVLVARGRRVRDPCRNKAGWGNGGQRRTTKTQEAMRKCLGKATAVQVGWMTSVPGAGPRAWNPDALVGASCFQESDILIYSCNTKIIARCCRCASCGIQRANWSPEPQLRPDLRYAAHRHAHSTLRPRDRFPSPRAPSTFPTSSCHSSTPLCHGTLPYLSPPLSLAVFLSLYLEPVHALLWHDTLVSIRCEKHLLSRNVTRS
jgi:hypothetical protein